MNPEDQDTGLDLLLVDDEDNFREALAERLRMRGMRVGTERSGEDCLATLGSRPAPVVILDVRMDGMDGLQTLERIKKEHPETEVLLLTGHSSTADGVRGIKLGAFDYLEKPADIDHLSGKIRQAREALENRRQSERERLMRRKLERELMESRRLAAMGVLSTGVAHEMNTPLAVINDAAGWMGQLLSTLDDPANLAKSEKLVKGLKKAQGMICKNVDRAKAITHQLLAYAKGAQSNYRPTDMESLVMDAADLLASEIEDRSLELELSLPQGAISIDTDPQQLRHVFTNVLMNAIQASPDHAVVSVEAREAGQRVEVVFKDRGHGISPKNMDMIFEPFFTTRPPGFGAGLGLFVAKGLVEKLGGSITAESSKEGTRFTLSLPRERRASQGGQ